MSVTPAVGGTSCDAEGGSSRAANAGIPTHASAPSASVQPAIAHARTRIAAASEVGVVRPRPAFRRDPVDDLVRVLDVAGLAVHAVGGVDLQALARLVGDDLVHAGRAEARARVGVFLGALRDADVG